ncbi:MAG TPA: hypothetical protein PLR74_14795 [Agriterribacter sp.]|nr:hypothetical protein [Agriterribacter sp.]
MADSDKKIQVAVVDDHTLLRNALARLIDSFDHFSVFFQAENGEELKQKLKKNYFKKN